MTGLDQVVILAGGLSAEREVSLRSGSRVRDELTKLDVDAVVLDADAALLTRLAAHRPTAVFPAIHGSCGEDGSI
ncbi:MAG TPA: D-alanine--D-alanine ligase, partial [Streptosporangiaceae bacterium]|nr:D-alanine--D-alanine ligase [Streptosporangiaceae bacterium]